MNKAVIFFFFLIIARHVNLFKLKEEQRVQLVLPTVTYQEIHYDNCHHQQERNEQNYADLPRINLYTMQFETT